MFNLLLVIKNSKSTYAGEIARQHTKIYKYSLSTLKNKLGYFTYYYSSWALTCVFPNNLTILPGHI